MENTKILFGMAALSALLLTGCQSTHAPEYYPGYYQEAKYHPARYERPYYDYYGNYHAGYVRQAYTEPGRWHRASVESVDNIGEYVYIEPGAAERQAEMEAGQIAADKNDVRAVVP